MTKVARRLGNCITIQCAWAASRAAQRAHGHDTALAGGTAPTIRRWGACYTHDTARRGAWHGGRHGARGTARRGARVSAATQHPGAAIRPGPSATTWLGPATIRPGLRAPGRAWGPVGPVLVLVHRACFSTWFFDSVVFLSHRLDPVHEHCSSQNFSKFFFH